MKHFSKIILFFSIIFAQLAFTDADLLAIELPFKENGNLYKSRVGDASGMSITKIASNVYRILDYDRNNGLLGRL